MRIHLQNPPGDHDFIITPGQWAAACARHPDLVGLDASFSEDSADLAPALRVAEVLVTRPKVIHQRFAPGALAAAAPRLRAIFCASAGLDRLAPYDWLPAGVDLLNNSGTHAAKAGEFALMGLLMLANHVPVFAHAHQQGRWVKRFGALLAGRTVCVIGLGSLGGAAAGHAKARGMRVLGVRTTPAPHADCDAVFATADLDTALAQSEFLVIACPLTAATRGLVDRRRLSLLPRGAKVLNIARGAVWDQDAACDLLDSGHLHGCITDVPLPEPLPPEHRLWRTSGMFVTPHMSAEDIATHNDLTLDILFANLRALRDGRALPNRVDPARGY
ncbi:NAD(P)-dependent oxidoreductase [Humitalea sp. 24SJ18S-53]|uniref:NAD(P)-dependent oxidoreductase n=1 Tax=Humitalea sp. 24SJ18S-53 TaxID=3422307 RepID=UPI003D67299C